MSEWQETEIISKVAATWKEYKLDEIGDFKNGANFNAQAFGFGYPVVNVKHLYKGRYAELDNLDEVKTETIKKIDDYELRNNDLLFARSSVTLEGTGQVTMVNNLPNRKFIFSGFIIRFRCTSSNVNSSFLSYLLRTKYYKEHFVNIAAGTSIINLSQDTLKKISVYLPDVEEQKSIASVLSSLDDKIDLLHRQNTTLERMAETLFRQWFVEEAQEDWEEKRIGDLVKVIDNRGKTPPYSDIPSLCPLIEVNALTGNNRLVDYSVIRKFVDEQTFKTWFRGHPKKYDSLISTVGSIGEISMFLVEKGSIAQNVIALSAVNICPVYLFEALKNIKDELKELDIGSVQPSIKVPHLLSLKIKIPSKDKIHNFSVIVKSYLEKMIVNYQQIQTLEKLRDNLLPKLMSGDVRVMIENEEKAA